MICPTCLAEYSGKLSVCPIDKAKLVNKAPKFQALVDLYAADGMLEAERIVEIFKEHDILAHDISEGVSQIPEISDSRVVISVEKEKVVAAKKLIEQAQADGIISKNGSFL